MWLRIKVKIMQEVVREGRIKQEAKQEALRLRKEQLAKEKAKRERQKRHMEDMFRKHQEQEAARRDGHAAGGAEGGDEYAKWGKMNEQERIAELLRKTHRPMY